ncbi:glycosyl transferase [Vibrio sp. UCD-FRSSP16_10]|uniref:glycosyltransferase family 9 protein n=1 Tax=unclassified Vibrio TaxID=2614977 RepID=UPI0007FEF05C|nr:MULTISPECIES: glycosyltransferase family 9 protein [unclassified Vibrio]OBT10109.1 glycosyl transferase [Vibrio sp. UCD-FRSSP16_30]OBT18899.1 glycosyl transferase [Vibrio sp. UCD-FRSSP16_10]
MTLFKSAPKSLCIVRLSAIGDVCHAIAVVQAIQKHWPETSITWVCGKIEAQLIGDLPNIKIVIFDKKLGFKGMKAVWKQLSATRFDALLHMQAALRASALSFGIKAKYKVGFAKNRTKEGQWFFTNKHLPHSQSFHVLDNFADFARYIGVPFSEPKWNIPLTDADIQFATKAIDNKPTLIISAAASKDSRNWLTERYAALADYASEKGMQVILCGSPSEREVTLANDIQQLAKSDMTNMVGKTSLKQLTALLKEAAVVLAPDSGPAHLATTQGTAVIGLYAHSDPRRTGPYNSLDLVANAYDEHIQSQIGKPLKDIIWGTRAKGDNLMASISVEQVCQLLNKTLEKN